MTASALEGQALARTRHLIHLANSRFGAAIPQPEVRFDLRGKSAGMAILLPQGEQVIRYNRNLLLENGRAFIDQTVPHEVAHLVARSLHGNRIKPHGAEWRSIMLLFGAEPQRCHRFPILATQSRKMRYYDYCCDCSDHRLSAIRHNRCRSGVTYLCRRCGSSLRRGLAGDR